MKFTCLQENLVKGLSTVSKAVSVRASLPVLSNVLLATDNGRLKLSATNLETAITCWIGASVEEEGSVTIPAKVLYEFVSNLPPSTISGESTGANLKITSDKVSSKLNGLDASEFPSLPETSDDIHLSIDPKTFGDAVLESAFAAAADETRPVLTGVLILANSEGLFLVGVDGFRLAERVVKVSGSALKKEFQAVVPSKILMEIGRLMSAHKDPMSISLNEDGNLVIFKVGDVLVSSRVIDGEFPKYKGLIPDAGSNNIKVKLNTKDFVSALKLANVFAKDSVCVIKLKVDPEEGVLHIHSSNNELGENSSRVEAEIEGVPIEVAFNSKYILDLMNNVKSDEFFFECSDKIGPGLPGVLKPVGRDNHTYLVMPMQF